MQELQENHYKERRPMDTVQRLRDILHGLGIVLYEDWHSKEGDACHSVRLRIAGTDIGTNGKGVTRAYALASAYAEFIERLQNSCLVSPLKFDVNTMPRPEFVDEIPVEAEQVFQAGGPFVEYLTKKIGLCADDDMLAALQFKLQFKGDAPGNRFFCRPYYCVDDGRVYYLPRVLTCPLYGSNGMCAGNAPEEALVQGVSEIVERFVQKKVIEERLSLPDLPEEYLRNFPQTYKTYCALCDAKPEGYEFYLKDASLGGRYPVAVFIASDRKTGVCGVRFGAHPDYGIAVERCLTEALQGKGMGVFARSTRLDFLNRGVSDAMNVYNSFKAGIAQYPVELFMKSEKKFVPCSFPAGADNRELLRAMLGRIREEGYHILVRDVSYLGIPSYHIIIPGLSDILSMTDKTMRSISSMRKTSIILRHLGDATDDELEIVRRYEDYIRYSHYDNQLASQFGVPLSYVFPGDEQSFGGLFLSAMICYRQENYEKAWERMKEFNRIHIQADVADKTYYSCVEEYIKGRMKGFPHKRIMEVLEMFFGREDCSRAGALLEDPAMVLRNLYPSIMPYHCEGCVLKEACHYDMVDVMYGKLMEKQREYFPDQANLKFITELMGE